jgi:hypothetical protein
MPDELKQKLVSLLAAEFSKKVYATVYADGPTRVLRFSDGKNLSSSEHQHVVLDLAFRLKQIEYELRDVNGQFARLGGIQNHHYFSGLDLYGRFKDDFAPDESRARELITKTLRKIPIPESTHQFVKQASRQIFSHSRSQSLEEIEFDPEDVLAGEGNSWQACEREVCTRQSDPGEHKEVICRAFHCVRCRGLGKRAF